MKRAKLKMSMIGMIIMLLVGLFSLPVLASESVDYLYYADEDAAISGTTTTGSRTDYTVVSNQTTWGTSGQTKWYGVNSSVTISDRISVSGDVHLILSNGCTLTASKGIGVNDDNSLTIYAQSTVENTMGVLKCQNVSSSYAAIGGDSSKSSGQITINGQSNIYNLHNLPLLRVLCNSR